MTGQPRLNSNTRSSKNQIKKKPSRTSGLKVTAGDVSMSFSMRRTMVSCARLQVSHYVGPAGLELVIVLLQPLECCTSRCLPPPLASAFPTCLSNSDAFSSHSTHEVETILSVVQKPRHRELKKMLKAEVGFKGRYSVWTQSQLE